MKNSSKGDADKKFDLERINYVYISRNIKIFLRIVKLKLDIIYLSIINE